MDCERWLDLARRFNQPLHMLAFAAWVRVFGTARARERLGLLSPRPAYAYGMFRAADHARAFGYPGVTVVEFGVATGAGLMAMVDLAEVIGRETGVRFRVVGFDAAGGLPPPRGFKDHPELWSAGDFAMVNREELERRLAGRAELILGDIADTVDGFARSISSDAPLGFVALDVDYYSSASAALRAFDGPPESCLPAVSLYLDDVAMFVANRWCGELAAVEEFNERHERRKIDRDRSLPGRRPYKSVGWYDRMYVLHVLDHPQRARPADRGALDLDADRRRLIRDGLI